MNKIPEAETVLFFFNFRILKETFATTRLNDLWTGDFESRSEDQISIATPHEYITKHHVLFMCLYLSVGVRAVYLARLDKAKTTTKKSGHKLINGMDQVEILMNRLQCQTMLIYYTFQFDASMLSNPNIRVDERNIWTYQTVNIFAKALNFNLII